MEIYIQQEDVIVYGIHVKTFPLGIKESFEGLMKIFGSSRSYYGISWFAEDGSIQYYSMIPESFCGEAEAYHYEKLTIPKGEYFTITVFNWLSKTDSIKDVFHELMAGNSPVINRPCIEWYKSDQEMLCMVRIR